ncbi:predicted Acetyl-CoA synthetase [Roseobacter sp. SK209-2-6]|uniref:acetate--CoA ligase family protein n=1 Tax=Roseobacter sp. SK209-2-6 TaxID=388739 RepID=UPI0000F3ED6E|nr:acetate--CoA ligase family protein [Roseobacter sp. SK209-2-6]EBA16811.1 predicted Acetyl-CoA synthetase [Roseobacter sp. SK209-2-6]
MSNALNRIFNAASIAIIGASNDPAKRGNQAIRKLRADGYAGAIYPINPKAPEVLGLKAYPSVLEVEGSIDVVLVCTPAKTLPAILAQCGEKGIPGAVVLAAGFSETGPEGEAIAEATLAAAKAHNVRLVGPNTNGVFNLHNNMNMVGVQDVEPGNIGICSQSGNMMLAFVTEAKRRGGVGFSSYVGVGNQLDVTLSEYLQYFADDADTKAPVFYVEGFRDGRAFLDTCREVTQRKPVIIYKSGRTEAGQVAASSHTGSLASSFALTRGLLKQAGATVVEQSDKILSIAEGLSKLPVPMGGKVAILADGGGHATVTVDALVDAGVELASLSPATIEKLRSILPAAASCVNPVDVAGGTDDNPLISAACAEAILADQNVDILMVIGMYGGFAARFNPALLEVETETSQRMAALAEHHGKPLIVQSVYNALRTRPIEALKDAGVPVFVWPEPAVRCVSELIGYAQARRRNAASPLVRPDEPAPSGTALVDRVVNTGRDAFYEYEAKDLLATYGIKVPGQFLARCEDDLTQVSTALGDAPMAMKIVSQDILHKSDAGGVKLRVSGEPALRADYREILANARAYNPDADVHGVLIAPMAEPGVEVIIGVVHDPMFGPVLMFGLGGIFVEVMKDVSFRALPMSRADAQEMVEEIQSSKVLDGVRGGLPVDKLALVDLMMKVSQLALAHPEIKEIDLNPVILRSDGYDIADARMILNSKGH